MIAWLRMLLKGDEIPESFGNEVVAPKAEPVAVVNITSEMLQAWAKRKRFLGYPEEEIKRAMIIAVGAEVCISGMALWMDHRSMSSRGFLRSKPHPIDLYLSPKRVVENAEAALLRHEVSKQLDKGAA